jgi:hypothetical protein
MRREPTGQAAGADPADTLLASAAVREATPAVRAWLTALLRRGGPATARLKTPREGNKKAAGVVAPRRPV